MRAIILSLFVTCSSASLAGAQSDPPAPIERTVRFTHTDSPQNIQEIGTLIRSIAEIRNVSMKPDARTLTLSGTAEQISLAEWLLPQLDASMPPSESAGVHEFRLAGTEDNIVRVYYLRHADTVPQLQEIATVARS